MKKILLFIIILSSVHNTLMPMKRAYSTLATEKEQPQKKQKIKPQQELLQFLTQITTPSDVLNIVTTPLFENKQWWYTDQLILNPDYTALDVFFTHKNECHGYAINPHLFGVTSNHSNTIVFDKDNNEKVNFPYTRPINSIKAYDFKKIAILINNNTFYLLRPQKHLNLNFVAMSSGNCLQWSPNGKLVALQNDQSKLTIYARPYLDKTTKIDNYKVISTFVEKNSINKVVFSNNNQMIAYATADKAIKVINIKEETKTFTYCHPNRIVIALTFNENSTLLSCAFYDGVIQTFDITQSTPGFNPSHISFYNNNNNPAWHLFYNNNQELMGWYLTKDETRIEIVNTTTKITTPIFYTYHVPSPIRCLEFNNACDRFGIGLQNGTIIFFKRYNPIIQQQILRHILHQWLCCQKPDKRINSEILLLMTVARMFNLKTTDLTTIWDTFPDYMQEAIWNTMNRLIQKYGK